MTTYECAIDMAHQPPSVPGHKHTERHKYQPLKESLLTHRLADKSMQLAACSLQERHKREVAEQDFEKASKAAAAEQARKDREQARLKEQAEVQQRLVAHKQGVKAAKTRVDRAALQSLGEAFAARLQVSMNLC